MQNHILPILHIGLGQLCDFTNQFQNFIMKIIYDHTKSEFIILEKLSLLKTTLQVFQVQFDQEEALRKKFYDLNKTAVNKEEKKAI